MAKNRIFEKSPKKWFLGPIFFFFFFFFNKGKKYFWIKITKNLPKPSKYTYLEKIFSLFWLISYFWKCWHFWPKKLKFWPKVIFFFFFFLVAFLVKIFISKKFKQQHLDKLKEVKTPWVLVGASNSGHSIIAYLLRQLTKSNILWLLLDFWPLKNPCANMGPILFFQKCKQQNWDKLSENAMGRPYLLAETNIPDRRIK